MILTRWDATIESLLGREAGLRVGFAAETRCIGCGRRLNGCSLIARVFGKITLTQDRWLPRGADSLKYSYCHGCAGHSVWSASLAPVHMGWPHTGFTRDGPSSWDSAAWVPAQGDCISGLLLATVLASPPPSSAAPSPPLAARNRHNTSAALGRRVGSGAMHRSNIDTTSCKAVGARHRRTRARLQLQHNVTGRGAATQSRALCPDHPAESSSPTSVLS